MFKTLTQRNCFLLHSHVQSHIFEISRIHKTTQSRREIYLLCMSFYAALSSEWNNFLIFFSSTPIYFGQFSHPSDILDSICDYRKSHQYLMLRTSTHPMYCESFQRECCLTESPFYSEYIDWWFSRPPKKNIRIDWGILIKDIVSKSFIETRWYK